MKGDNDNKANENFENKKTRYRSSSQNRKKKADIGNFDNADYRHNMRSMGPGDFMDFSDNSDVRCEDHFKNLSEDFAAERYCSRCQSAVCSSCIIDHHSSHIKDAKMKIDDFIISQRKEVDSLKPLIFTSTHKNEILDSINKNFVIQNAEFARYLEKRKLEIDDMKNNLDKIFVLETRIINEFKEKSEGTYNEMFNSKLKDLLEKSNVVSLEIVKLIEAWDKISKQEKMDLVKKNKINNLKQDANSKRSNLSLEVDIIKGDVLNLIDFVKSYRADLARSTLTNGVEIEINSILTTLKDNFDKIEKIDIMRVVKNFGFNDNNNPKGNVPSKSKNDQNDLKSADTSSNSFNQQNNKNFRNNYAKNEEEKKPINPKINPFTVDADNEPNISVQSIGSSNIITILSEKDSSNTAFSNAIANSFGYEFFIGIKPGYKNIKVFDPKAQKIFNYELSKLMFKDKSNILDDFLNNCRYVNLGFSALISGGLANASSVTNSYLLIVKRNPKALGSDDLLQISLVPYSSMNDSRERHCMINLPDKNKVLVCSGFLKKTVEINNIGTGIWTSLASLSEIRANATGAYINNRYAYIFGGFKLENGKGFYNNSAEVLDLTNENSSWKLIDFDNKYSNNSIRITAAGVLHYSNEKVLLCGGYNGTVYLKDVYCVEHRENNIDVFEKTKLQLADELIFFHSAFVRCGGSAVNFDYKMDLNVYNPLTKEFKLYK